MSDNNRNNNYNHSSLQDSELTQPTDGGSVSEDETGWLGTIGADFRNLATCFKDTIPPVLGGVATLVHNTAMSVAAEIAQLERESELEAERWREDNESPALAPAPADIGVVSWNSLPWELATQVEGSDNNDSHRQRIFPVKIVTDRALMEEILSLSLDESTFLEPYSASPSSTPVKESSSASTGSVLDEPNLDLIRRLLDIDPNLKAMHARFTGRSQTEQALFWRNYFFHCEKIRKIHMKRMGPNYYDDDYDDSIDKTATGTVGQSGVLSKVQLAEPEPCDGDHNDSSSTNVDDSSLIPASMTDDLSYVIPSAPNSINTLTTTRSIDDLVLVGRETESMD